MEGRLKVVENYVLFYLFVETINRFLLILPVYLVISNNYISTKIVKKGGGVVLEFWRVIEFQIVLIATLSTAWNPTFRIKLRYSSSIISLYIHTQTRTHRHTPVPTQKHMQVRTHSHRNTHTHTHPHTDPYIRTDTNKLTHTQTHTNTEAHTHTHKHTHIHIHIHTRTHIHE